MAVYASVETNAAYFMAYSKEINYMRARRNRRPFADDSFTCIYLNEHILIQIKVSLKFIPKCPITNIPTLVQIMAWRRLGDKPLSEPKIFILLTHICVPRPQRVSDVLKVHF